MQWKILFRRLRTDCVFSVVKRKIVDSLIRWDTHGWAGSSCVARLLTTSRRLYGGSWGCVCVTPERSRIDSLSSSITGHNVLATVSRLNVPSLSCRCTYCPHVHLDALTTSVCMCYNSSIIIHIRSMWFSVISMFSSTDATRWKCQTRLQFHLLNFNYRD